VALVLVLWVCVLLTVIAISLVSTQRTELSMTINTRQEFQGRALVDAGTRFMVWQLTRADGRGGKKSEWPADGLLRDWAFAGGGIRVSAVPETGRIDLNAAAPELLEGLLKGAGLESEEVARIKDAIQDWRDPDSNHRLNGAEDADYRAAGLLYGAGDADFASVGELQMVLGVTPALFARLAPSLTVYAGRPTINPVVASPEVLQALPGMQTNQLAAYLALRKRNRAQGLPVPLPIGVDKRFIAQTGPPTYRIYADTDLEGVRVRGEILVKMGAGDKGYAVLERSYSPRATPEQAPKLEEEPVE
jgi:general secretion pathway protein K